MLLGAFVYAFKYALTRGYHPVMETSGVVACTVGMAFSMAQNLAVISAAPTAWPGLLLDTVAALRILTLNIESLGVACPFPDAFGTDQLYLCQALAFPVILCLLLATSSLSKRLSALALTNDASVRYALPCFPLPTSSCSRDFIHNIVV